ncbi:hypothetical protein [Acidithiobacillus caldus]|uniref:hypothetical protein n=1 Tax=Acidithiobacillus caldus TaxID=33059 RepID=UPI0007D98CA0|nr:hypothetical protein [Acidithiobacillus caldus]
MGSACVQATAERSLRSACGSAATSATVSTLDPGTRSVLIRTNAASAARNIVSSPAASTGNSQQNPVETDAGVSAPVSAGVGHAARPRSALSDQSGPGSGVLGSGQCKGDGAPGTSLPPRSAIPSSGALQGHLDGTAAFGWDLELQIGIGGGLG